MEWLSDNKNSHINSSPLITNDVIDRTIKDIIPNLVSKTNVTASTDGTDFTLPLSTYIQWYTSASTDDNNTINAQNFSDLLSANKDRYIRIDNTGDKPLRLTSNIPDEKIEIPAYDTLTIKIIKSTTDVIII